MLQYTYKNIKYTIKNKYIQKYHLRLPNKLNNIKFILKQNLKDEIHN